MDENPKPETTGCQIWLRVEICLRLGAMLFGGLVIAFGLDTMSEGSFSSYLFGGFLVSSGFYVMASFASDAAKFIKMRRSLKSETGRKQPI